MSNDQPQFTPRKKLFLNDWRQPHPTSEAPLEGAKFPAQFLWELTNAGKVVFKINDGIWKEGAKTTHKEVEMGAYQRGILFNSLLEAANNPEFTIKQYIIKKPGFVRTGGQSRMSDQPITHGTFTIKRDDRGVITLGYSKGDYKTTTSFRGPNNDVIMMRNEAGELVEDIGFMSRMYLRSWVDFHKRVLDRMELDGWTPPVPKGDKGKPAGDPNKSTPNNFDDDFDDMF